MRRLIGLAAIAAVVALSACSAAEADRSGPNTDPLTDKWHPCSPRKDGPLPCVWDGEHMGTGEGRSFLLRQSGEKVFVSHEQAHRTLGWE